MRGSRIAYSAAEWRWLEANRMMVISDYHRAFCAAFNRSDVSAQNLHGLRKRKGWKVGRDPGRYVGRNTKYSPAAIAWLRANCTMSIRDYHRAFCAQFKSEVTACALNQLRKKHGWKTGRSGHFAKGSVPWSKGKKIGNNAGSARTQFRKSVSPINIKYAGHERVRKADGYIEISVNQTNPHTGFERRYVLKHKWLWEQMHGPVPEGMALKCKGHRQNTDPSNWEIVPRGLLPRLNGRSGRGYDDAPAELKPTIMAVAKLEHSLSKKAARA